MKPGWWFRAVWDAQWLSSDARALLCWFATRHRGWRYSVEGNAISCGWGVQKYKRVLRECKDSGYLKTGYKRNPSGQIIAVAVSLRDQPEVRKSALRGGVNRRADSKPAGQKAENQPGIRSPKRSETEPVSEQLGEVIAFDQASGHV